LDGKALVDKEDAMRAAGVSWFFAVLAAIAGLQSAQAGAGAPTVPANSVCRPAIVSAEASGRLPARLLEAIALVESGRLDKKTGLRNPWPWTINAEGEGYFFDTKDQAIAAVKALQSRGVMSIDVGCMQVNLMHHPDAFATLEQAFDPKINAIYAARFLNALYARTTNWPQATAFYHSQTPERGADYARRVMAAWERPSQAPAAPFFNAGSAYNLGFAAFPRSGYVDVVQGGTHFRAFVAPSQNFAAFGRTP
jgi:hypothetical protein